MKDFIVDVLHIIKGKLTDYKTLAQYHYRTEPIGPTTNIYKVCAKYPYQNTFPNPLAVIVYRMPLANLRARTTATGEYFHKGLTPSNRLKLVNQHIRYIARLIVDPRFHRCGIATWLLEETLKSQTVPIIETLTPLDFTNKIFQRAGFNLHETPAPAWYNRFKTALLSLGLTPDSLYQPEVVQHRLDNLNKFDTEFIERKIKSFLHHYRHHQQMPLDLSRTKYFLSKIPFPQAYLIWFNPNVPLTG